LFDSLPDTNVSIEPTGIIITYGDSAAAARTLSTAFSIVFTRVRVSDRYYSWHSIVDDVPIIFRMVEVVDNDLTGTPAPL
jgi:hypothetical protein